MTTLMIAQIVLLILLIAASAFFSSSETALFALGNTTLKRWASQGTRYQAMAAKLMHDHHATLVAILLGTNFVNILTTVLFDNLTERWFSGVMGTMITGALATLILLVFGEVTPKAIAYVKAEQLAPKVAPIIVVCLKLFHVPIVLLKWCTAHIVSFTGKPDGSNALTAEEHQSFVTLGENLGAFSAHESRLLERIFRLREINVAAVMIPRLDIDHLDTSLSAGEVSARIRRYRHRRLPAADDDLDDVVGVFDVGRFHAASPNERENWTKTCIHPPLYVPEHASLDQALTALRENNETMALAVDEYGGINGLITSEDIIEEVLGDMMDEYDQAAWNLLELRPGHWRLSGMIALHELETQLNLELPEGNSETLGGLISEELGRLPKPGDSWSHHTYTFHVLKVDRRRIIEVDVIDSDHDERKD